MIIDIIKVKNEYAPYFIGRLSGKKLLSLAKADLRKVINGKDSTGIQRKINRAKVIQISKYIDSPYAVFPNSIILNLNSKFIINIGTNNIEVSQSEKVFQIIDGQHRVEAFNDSVRDFDVLVSIFIDLPKYKMAEIFKTINSNQKPLPASLREELESETPINTPEKIAVLIAKDFAFSTESPLYHRISIYGYEGFEDDESLDMLSLAAFVSQIVSLIYIHTTYYHVIKSELYTMELNNLTLEDSISNIERKMKIDEKKYVFWKYYRKNDSDSIKKILNNYFSAIKTVFENDFNTKSSILLKTTGYRALMKLFIYAYNIGYLNKDLTYDFFIRILTPLSILDGTINSDKYRGSSNALSDLIYKDFLRTITKKNQAVK